MVDIVREDFGISIETAHASEVFHDGLVNLDL